MKPYLSRTKTLPLANPYFVNRLFTNNYPCNNLSVNALRKTSKKALFRPSDPFVRKVPLHLGSKLE